MKKVLLLGGASEAAAVAGLLLPHCQVIVSVYTSYGDFMLPEGVQIRKGPLDATGLMEIIREKKLLCIVDVTHPYAAEVSQNAMLAAQNAGVPYFRYQRPKETYNNAVVFQNIPSLIEALNALQGNILMTTGTKTLSHWKKVTAYEKRVFLRVLPASSSVAACEKEGFSYKNIIALTGPFSVEMNRSIIRHTNAVVLVSKDGGGAGGTLEKAQASEMENILFYLLDRPVIKYNNEFSSIKQLTDAVLSFITGGRRK